MELAAQMIANVRTGDDLFEFSRDKAIEANRATAELEIYDSNLR